jgi:NADH:ubiquinone reductase (H+-translocating)
MSHRILILGAGYAGAITAGMLARRLRSSDAEITLVNAAPNFVERVRLHQLAVGQQLPDRPLRNLFAATPVTILVDTVTALDVGAHQVALAGGGVLEYDSLVVGLGSAQAPPDAAITGGTVHTVASREGALRLRDGLYELGSGGSVVVVGGGLTGLETATEIAEARPDLDVTLLSRGTIGGDLAPKGARHVHRALERLGITVREGVRAREVTAAAVLTDDGRSLPADLVVWTGGFVTNPLAAASELETHEDGRIVVDRAMRSVSHPGVYAVGDAAWAIGHGGRPLRMSCAAGTAMGWQAAEGLLADLRGRPAPKFPLAYVTRCISLGRRDALVQVVRPDDSPRSLVLTGRVGAWNKETICRGAAFGAAHPTLGIPIPARSLP